MPCRCISSAIAVVCSSSAGAAPASSFRSFLFFFLGFRLQLFTLLLKTKTVFEHEGNVRRLEGIGQKGGAGADFPMSAAVTLETDQEFSGAFIKLSGCLLRGATIQKRIYTMRAFFPSIFSFYELQMVLMLTQSMKNGTIDWFSPEKGYGFIMPDDGGKAVFVHISALEQAGLQKLSKGQRVSFEISTVKGKASASTLNLQTATLREAKSIDLNRTKYAYVFTETTALLVRNRIAHILMLCILSAAYTYFRGIHLMIIILWCGIAAGLMLDLWLIRLRYVNNTYGQSALELAEIGRYLEQKAHIDKDDIGGGQRIEFIIEDEKEWDAIPQGAVQTA